MRSASSSNATSCAPRTAESRRAWMGYVGESLRTDGGSHSATLGAARAEADGTRRHATHQDICASSDGPQLQRSRSWKCHAVTIRKRKLRDGTSRLFIEIR